MKNHEWSRRSVLTGSTLIAAAGLATPLLASCAGPSSSSTGSAGSSLDRLRKQGFVNVGVFGSQVYGYTDKSGRVTGEGPEVARAVFAKLGVAEIRATQMSFDQLIPALSAGQFDVACAGMYITPARCKNALFSRPDFTVNEGMIVPKGNPLNVKTLEDIANKNVKATMAASSVERGYGLSAGIKAENIISYESGQAMLEAVAAGRVYAAVMSDLSTRDLVKQNPGATVEIAAVFRPAVKGKPVNTAAGFVFRQDAQQLVDEFNRELGALQNSGEWLKIVEPFGFTKENLPANGLTTQQLCSAT